MKTTKQILFVIAFLVSTIFSKSQTPNTCTAAISKSYPLSTFTVTGYSDSTYWFKMSLNAGDYQIKLINQSTSGKVYSLGAYIGSCGSQTLVSEKKVDSNDSTSLELFFSIAASQTVYFKLNNIGSNSSFIASAIPMCLVSGNIGFCSGQTVTLTAQSWNYVGTPTYTWLPGASNATVITISPTSSTTYTLIYNSGVGIVTHTVTIFPLPSNLCNSCDYVYNGSFESFGPHPGYLIKEAWNWTFPGEVYLPTGGLASAANFMSSSFNSISSSSGVPTSLYHSNLPAKTGHSYSHFRMRSNGAFPFADQRGYAEQQLKQPLATGQTYSVSFYLAHSDYCGTPNVAANFGAYLSTSTVVIPFANVGYVFSSPAYTPQVVCTTTAISCYTWTPVSGTVTGAGEQYITLGNFSTDAATPSYSTAACATFCATYSNNVNVQMSMDDLSIVPVPASLSVSNPTITNCSQTTITLTASGAAPAYTSWTDGTNTYTGAVVVVPVSPFLQTYTCNVNLPGVGSCGLGGTVSVYNACTSCSTPTNVLPTTLTSTTLSNTFYAMNSNLIIYGNVTLDKCEIQIIKSASITVTPGATLNILGSHLYACGDMWQGIDVQTNGSINLNTSGAKSSFIEDAIVAVNIAGGSTLTTNILTSISTSYNRNKSSMNIAGYSPTISPYPFTIYGNLFTSRIINYTIGSINWPHTNTIKAATNPTTSPLETPYINNTTYVPANLKAPYSTVKPDWGIYLDGVGTTINESTNPTFFEIKIGIGTGLSNTYNIFDNLYRGIKATGANISCINNIFQSLSTYGKGGNSGGIGIDVAGAAAAHRLRVAGTTPTTFINKFFNCCRAINSSNYFEHIITDCDLRSTIVAPVLPSTVGNVPGAYGFNLVTAQYRVLNASGNRLYNIANGILFTADVGYYWNTSLGRYGGQVNIDNNEIRNHLPSYSVTTQFVNSAISANDVMTSTSGYSVFTIPSTSISINSNTITGVWNGISQSNFGQQPATVWNNTITLVNQPSAIGPPVQYGIQNNQVSNGFIYRNTVSGPATYTTQMKAITTSMNSTLTVKCNTTSQTDRGIEFNSTQANTIFWDNTMNNTHVYGVAIDNAGIIGTQGSTTVPSDNQWPGTWGTTSAPYKTSTKGTSTSTNSPFYVRFATGSYDPNGSSWTDLFTGTDNYCYSCTGNSLLNITGSPSARTCPATPLCPTCRGVTQVEIIPSNEPLLEQLANGKIIYKEKNAETQYINKLALYRQIVGMPRSKKSNSSDLNSFYNTNARTNVNELNEIEIDLLSGNYNSAKTKILGFAIENSIEVNYINYYTSYINSKQGNFTSTDSVNLTALANGCPFTDGGVVYQARALYNVVFDTYHLFYDICYNDSTSQRLINSNEQKTISTVKFSRIYPNPTNGLLNVEVSNAIDKEEISVDVFDITGKSVYSSKQVLNNKTVVLHPDLNSGTYLVKIKLSDGTTDVHRLVISK